MNRMDMDSGALYNTGNQLLAANDLAGAEACFREAVRIAPGFAEAYANLGLVLDRRGETGEAEACYRRSIESNAHICGTHLNLGALLATLKQFDEAEAEYKAAIALNGHSPAAWSNLGALYACVKREEEAEECYRKALGIDEHYAAARFNWSYLLLLQGRFEEGWSCLEARDWYSGLAAHLQCPRWRGEDLAGKTLLIGFEAGHGDMIQFCRYATVLKAKGALHITILCHPGLKTLFTMLEGVDSAIAFDEVVPRDGWDYWTPPLSIPYYCGTRIESIPAPIPYLRAFPDQSLKWRKAFPRDVMRVGLVWKGNPRFENDDDRSLASLDLLAPLGAVADVHFFSLQKGAGECEAGSPPQGLPLTDLAPVLRDFADTAAVVANLDLVIGVDTAVVHLAGALGTRCWVMLPYYKPDWRWLEGRTDSPWYPGAMRLYRQRAMGDWENTIAEVAAALEAHAQEWHACRRNLLPG
jgi:tetratricopeptide (TPR) repeat protein